MRPDLLAEFVTAFTAEWNRLTREQGASAVKQQRELTAVERKLDNLIDAIANGLKAPGLQARLDALESQKAELQASLAKAPPPAPALHPNIGEVYRRKVSALDAALTKGCDAEAMEAARTLIAKVIVHPPTEPDGPPGIELIGDLASMLATAGISPHDKNGSETTHAVLAAFTSSTQAQPSPRSGRRRLRTEYEPPPCGGNA